MNRPDNIVLIVSDQHRADWMSCSGSRAVHTPNLDALAAGGVRFTNAYCNAPVCVPSRMSMLTGRQPHRLGGVYVNAHSLSSDIPTFAHGLSLAGYETVLGGRMHFSGADQRHGYQHRLVGDINPSYPGGPTTNWGTLTPAQGMHSIESAGPGDSAGLRYDDAVVEACESYVDERSRAPAAPPLFLTVGLFGPHSPFTAPQELYDQAEAAYDAADPPHSLDPEPRHPWVADWFRRLEADRMTPEQLRMARANYAGLVNRLDQLVGRIVEAVRSLPGETVVIYLSDHGEMAGDRGMFWKLSFYEGAVKVPLIWRSLSDTATPDTGIASGATVNIPVSLVDLAPTLVGMSGAPPMPNVDGLDLAPLLSGGLERAEHDRWFTRPVFSESVVVGSPIRMVRRGDDKLIYYHDHPPPQLFDLAADPHEQQDLGQSAKHEDARHELVIQVLTNWEPERLKQHAREKETDLQYLTHWGEEVGMGPMEIWESYAASHDVGSHG